MTRTRRSTGSASLRLCDRASRALLIAAAEYQDSISRISASLDKWRDLRRRLRSDITYGSMRALNRYVLKGSASAAMTTIIRHPQKLSSTM